MPIGLTPKQVKMKDIAIALGFASLLAGLAEVMLELFGVESATLRWLIIMAMIIGGAGLAIIGLILKTRKSSVDGVGIIMPDGYKSLDLNWFQKIIKWLREN